MTSKKKIKILKGKSVDHTTEISRKWGDNIELKAKTNKNVLKEIDIEVKTAMKITKKFENEEAKKIVK